MVIVIVFGGRFCSRESANILSRSALFVSGLPRRIFLAKSMDCESMLVTRCPLNAAMYLRACGFESVRNGQDMWRAVHFETSPIFFICFIVSSSPLAVLPSRPTPAISF
eukprot:7391147-Prymnesium_polylepis.1